MISHATAAIHGHVRNNGDDENPTTSSGTSVSFASARSTTCAGVTRSTVVLGVRAVSGTGVGAGAAIGASVTVFTLGIVQRPPSGTAIGSMCRLAVTSGANRA